MKTKSKPARLVVGYCRVSTVDQAVEGVSLAAQQERIADWSRASGNPKVPIVFADKGLSGKRADNRPGLAAALDEVCLRSGVLVVYSLSRLARSVRDTLAIAERLERSKADLVSLSEQIDTSSSMGKMFFRLMAVLAEFERDQIVERTKAALDHKRSLGERIGQVPYGKRLDADGVTLLDDPAELAIIDWIRAKRSEGWSLRAIATGLELLEKPTKNGGRWSKTTVARLLAREPFFQKNLMTRPSSSPSKPIPRSLSLADHLRLVINSRNLSASEVARIAGVDPRSVARFLYDDRDLALSTAGKIADALGLRLAESPGSRRLGKGRGVRAG